MGAFRYYRLASGGRLASTGKVLCADARPHAWLSQGLSSRLKPLSFGWVYFMLEGS